MLGVRKVVVFALAVTSFWCLHPHTLGFLLCTKLPWAVSVLGCKSQGGSRGRGTVLANRMRSRLLVMLHKHLCRRLLAGPAQHAAGTHLEITSKGQNAGGGFRPDGDPAPTGFLSVSPSRGVGTWRGVRGAERCPWQVVRGEDLSARGGGAAPQAQIRGSLPDP